MAKGMHGGGKKNRMIEIDLMQVNYIIRQLDLNKGAFEKLLTVTEPEQALWKPAPDKWCLLEIICHLVDEEAFDFRTRVNTALYPDKYPFVSIDPVGWVTEKRYMEQDYEDKVNEWLDEREKSLHWLQSLNAPNWQSHLTHPDLGNMSAMRFLANWLAHDHIHIRQILKVKQAYLAHITGENLSYAGNW